MQWITRHFRRAKSDSVTQKSPPMRRVAVESLEARTFLSTTPTPGHYVVQFYGLGGAGGFGEDWLDNIGNQAAKTSNSTLSKYDEDLGGQALKDFLHAIDRNHDKIITAGEVKKVELNVVGYSFGGIQAVNFAADLTAGTNVKGYHLSAGVPIHSLVAIDPVNAPPVKFTAGVTSNVDFFFNYYQEKGGDTTVDVSMHSWPHLKLTSISVPDPANIVGGPLKSAAHHTTQIRVDTTWAGVSATHEVYSGADGKVKGNGVNHGTMPFFAYDYAVTDLTK